ncbi:MAG: 1-phosphofructokinase, partial [uncultured Solirubrobacteraceae bacterium]
DHHRHPQRGDRQEPLRPELPARPAAQDRRPDHDGRRQGRQRRPRAEGPRAARHRHGLRGRADGHPDRRAAHAGVDPQRLRAHPRGVAHEHRRVRPDERGDDGDQRARPRRVAQGGRALPRQAALPRARRGHRRVRGLAAARDRRRHLRGPHPRAAPDERQDDDRHGRRAAAAGRPRRARRHLAERPRGGGARGPRVQRRGGPGDRRARDGPARAPRGDHDRAGRVRRLRPGRRPADAHARLDRAARDRGGGRLGRRVPGRLRRHALPGPVRRGGAALRRRVRCGVHAAPGRRPHRPARGRAHRGGDDARAPHPRRGGL